MEIFFAIYPSVNNIASKLFDATSFRHLLFASHYHDMMYNTKCTKVYIPFYSVALDVT